MANHPPLEPGLFAEPHDEAGATHLGWQLAAADADHDLLPQVEFVDTAPEPAAAAARAGEQPEPEPELVILDNAIDDAPLASPPVLWDGEATFQEPMVVFGASAAAEPQGGSETVFS